MSTNKTTNYKLHSWVAGDKFLREEMNENFNKLDISVPRVMSGVYSGDGNAQREIVLGFQPRAVFVISPLGTLGDMNYTAGGMAVEGGPCSKGGEPTLSLTEDGFRVYCNESHRVQTNLLNEIRHYIAFG